MRRLAIALSVLAAVAVGAACSSSESDSNGGGPTDADGSVDEGGTSSEGGGDGGADARPACASTHFGAAVPFALPATIDTRFAETPLRNLAASADNCATGTLTYTYSTTDLTGDGRPDLVVTRDGCSPDLEVGKTKWTVYPGTTSGFGAAQAFALPAAIDARFAPTPMRNLAAVGDNCATGTLTFTYTTTDLTGDGKPDLVVTRDGCTPDLEVGKSKWVVYPWTATGFGAAKTFALPAAIDARFAPTPMRNLATVAESCAAGTLTFTYTTTDLTGDGKPDLVVTRDGCTPDLEVGKTKWIVYPGTGSGFGAAQSWALPSAIDARFAVTPLRNLAGVAETCAAGTLTYTYSTTDLTGDGKPDLVMTRDGCGPDLEVGKTKWVVYPNTGSGFGAAKSFALPAAIDARFAATPLRNLAGVAETCASGTLTYTYSTTDLNGDGNPDLVMTRDGCGPDLDVGKTKWTVYPGTGSGFGAAQSFALPGVFDARFAATPLRNLAGVAETCATGTLTYTYSTTDLNGDHLPDLVLTRDGCGPDLDVGKKKWIIFPGACGL